MADEPVKFLINSNIIRLAVAGSMARAALGKILKDGKGRLTVYYDDSGALHVVGDHGSPSAANGSAEAAEPDVAAILRAEAEAEIPLDSSRCRPA